MHGLHHIRLMQLANAQKTALDPASFFITTWQTTNPDESITIPTTGTGYNYRVDWGDGITTTGHTGNATHTYAVAGIYTVKISGSFPRIFFNNTGSKEKIQSIEQWGTQVWESLENAFWGCTNLKLNTFTPPAGVISGRYNRCFLGCNVTSGLRDWNMEGIEVLVDFLSGCANYNEDVSGWNVSNVIAFTRTFRNTSLNQNLGSWNLASVVSMERFLQNVTMSTANYSNTLIGWAENPNTANDVVFDGGNSKYNAAGAAARATLVGKGWTITDGGAA